MLVSCKAIHTLLHTFVQCNLVFFLFSSIISCKCRNLCHARVCCVVVLSWLCGCGCVPAAQALISAPAGDVLCHTLASFVFVLYRIVCCQPVTQPLLRCSVSHASQAQILVTAGDVLCPTLTLASYFPLNCALSTLAAAHLSPGMGSSICW